MEQIELNAFDLRLEHTRCKNAIVERRLLTSIMERDIEEPLSVAQCEIPDMYVLIDGFKRYRCARKLGKGMVPAQSVAQDVPCAILAMIRRRESHGLSTLEQSAMIEELHKRYNLSIYDIALRLNRSPSWVSMRLGMIEELTPLVRTKILSGAFPVRAYMYGIKGFTRVNRIAPERIDALVTALSGKGLSTRELFTLSRAYFTGGTTMERLIIEGDARRALRMLSAQPDCSAEPSLDGRQREFIKDLGTTLTGMNRIIANGADMRQGAAAFMQHVNHWSGAIGKRLTDFSTLIKGLYADSRTGQTSRGSDVAPAGRAEQIHSGSVAS